MCKQGGAINSVEHLIPYIGYQTKHAKEHGLNSKTAITPTLRLNTMLSLSYAGDKVVSTVNTSLVFKFYKFTKIIELTEQKLEYCLRDKDGNLTF